MRSRVAAQTLTRKKFTTVYNLTGGIKAWKKEVAVGDEDSGLHLFTGEESPKEAVIIGFGLEMGLRDFYLSMQSKVVLESTKTLFAKLADIEVLHQQQLAKLYQEITATPISAEALAGQIEEQAMEGGLTTEEYLQLYNIDLESEIEVLGLAMAIEAQALDLYLRAAERSDNNESKQVLFQIAGEERSHIDRLSKYIDQQQDLL